MKITTKEIKINKTLNNMEIEKELLKFGDPIRWAVVDIVNNEFLIDAVYINN